MKITALMICSIVIAVVALCEICVVAWLCFTQLKARQTLAKLIAERNAANKKVIMLQADKIMLQNTIDNLTADNAANNKEG
jgi:hypothetical protein